MFRFTSLGSFSNTMNFLNKAKNISDSNIYTSIANDGVSSLRNATPKRSGLTADSWDYDINKKGNNVTIDWINKNENQGYNIAILIQYGHGTGTGGYVPAIDYVNPAMKTIFSTIIDVLLEEVMI